MAEAKMGTHYLREMVEVFSEIAADNKFPELSAKLLALNPKLEIVAGKIYFKTQKGNEQMEKMAGEMGDLKAKLAGCADAAAAGALLNPFITQLDELADFVAAMKVRMT
jgi:hypothetical protein